MFPIIYCEKEVVNHPRAQKIIERFPDAELVIIDRFSEIFNDKKQNFRLQKSLPSLILAKKYGRLVLPTPLDYSIGSEHNFYFSHMYNCIYDCRYCFLQGMYQSANYVLFVNFEDFFLEIKKFAQIHKGAYFFSGYDCDSLALESLTGFAKSAVRQFENIPESFLEIRTKSCAIQRILEEKPLPNVVIAYTLTPSLLAETVEHKAPSFLKRLKSLRKLQDAGWMVGLRFDPLLFHPDWKKLYSEMFLETFSTLKEELIHSVTLGVLRFPKAVHQKIAAHYPSEPLLQFGMESDKKRVSYVKDFEEEIIEYSLKTLFDYVSNYKIFSY